MPGIEDAKGSHKVKKYIADNAGKFTPILVIQLVQGKHDPKCMWEAIQNLKEKNVLDLIVVFTRARSSFMDVRNNLCIDSE